MTHIPGISAVDRNKYWTEFQKIQSNIDHDTTRAKEILREQRVRDSSKPKGGQNIDVRSIYDVVLTTSKLGLKFTIVEYRKENNYCSGSKCRM